MAGDLIGAVFNPGAYTHTSLALHDAIKGAKLRLIECHISNVHTREEFRSHSFISPAAAGIVVGFGVDGYAVAIHGLHLLSTAAVPSLATKTAPGLAHPGPWTLLDVIARGEVPAVAAGYAGRPGGASQSWQ